MSELCLPCRWLYEPHNDAVVRCQQVYVSHAVCSIADVGVGVLCRELLPWRRTRHAIHARDGWQRCIELYRELYPRIWIAVR